jgi:hypothetical protein
MADEQTENTQKEHYKQVLTTMLQGLSEILDDHIIKEKVKDIKGLKIGANSKIEVLEGNPQKITLEVMDKFIDLSNEVVAKTFQPLLKKYPWIKVPKLD